MKRIAGWILTAVFLSVLCIPCAAADTGAPHSRFSDVAENSRFFPAVRQCCEAGLLEPAGEHYFGVQEPLTKADMVRLLARLYNLRLGGDGRIPALPENLGDYIRFFDEEGALVHHLFSANCLDFVSVQDSQVTAVFYSETLSQERLTMEVGFPEDETTRIAEGVRLGYDPEEACTRYRFTFPEGTGVPDLTGYQKDAMSWRSTWEVNRNYHQEDPTPYDAVLYLLYRTPERLPLCFRTMFLDAMPYESVWRMELAVPLAALCRNLPEVWEADFIPDLPDWRFHDEETAAVLSLYRQGILEGFDEAGTFAGADWLTRGQAALVAARFTDAIQAEKKSVL